MTFRTKLLLAFTLTVAAAVGLVAWAVSTNTRRAFERFDGQRTAALLSQFQREFARRGEEVGHRLRGIAEDNQTVQMAVKLSQPQPDYGLYVNDARGLAQSHGLDFLELVAHDGTIISSAHWPARFGYKKEWLTEPSDWAARGPFLEREELPDGSVALALLAVRTTLPVEEKKVYVVGGLRLDHRFLASLPLPEGLRALLYSNLSPDFTAAALADAKGAFQNAEKLQPLIEQVLKDPRDQQMTVQWSLEASSAETFHATPLLGRQKELLGVLLVGSSRADLVAMLEFIRLLALLVGGGGVLLGLLFSWWVAARVTRPVRQLAAGARSVATGKWDASVEVHSRDEIGELARAFNHMTRQLAEQREQLIQAERVAAWRELARRLAHELKNPLFPLQITVENLQRAREQGPADQFDEVFFESTATLLAEIRNLKAIVARFSDFARMPPPVLQPVNVNELVRGVVRLFEAQFSGLGRPAVTAELFLEERLPEIQADPDLLRRALENLVLNAQDAMPAGGTLTIRTFRQPGGVRLEVSDTGRGLTPEECQRLFTPYYTTKQCGTGLGLAIVQSVVSDHGGRISVDSEPGFGTTFRIELHEQPPQGEPTGAAADQPVPARAAEV